MRDIDGGLDQDTARVIRQLLELPKDAPIGDDECRRYMAHRHGLPENASWKKINKVAGPRDRKFDDWLRKMTQ